MPVCDAAPADRGTSARRCGAGLRGGGARPSVLDAELDPAEPLGDRWRPDLLGGVTEVEAGGTVACEDGSGPAPLYVPFGSRAAGSRRPVRMGAIPYWTWANPSAIGYGCLGPACVAEREGGAARRGAAPQFSAFRPTGSWPRFS